MPGSLNIPKESLERDAFWMKRALQLADQAAIRGEVPIGAVVVVGDVEVAAAGNTRESAADPTGHAEINVLRAAGAARGHWRLDDATVYVTLEPCAMCAGAMVLARIVRCVYAAPDPKGGFLGTLGNLAEFPGLNHRFEVSSGVLQAEASEQLRSFFRSLRSKDR